MMVKLVYVGGLPLGRLAHAEEIKVATSCLVAGHLTTEGFEGDVIHIGLKKGQMLETGL